MGGRHVAKSTKLSDQEFTALLDAISQQGSTVSTYIADSVAERLVREGYLAQHAVDHDEAAVECTHPATARRKFPWGSKCEACDKVLTGSFAS